MSNVAREIKDGVEIRLSVHTPDYTGKDWLINPLNVKEMSKIPWHDRKIVDGAIIEKTQEEKDAYQASLPPPGPTLDEKVRDLEGKVKILEDR